MLTVTELIGMLPSRGSRFFGCPHALMNALLRCFVVLLVEEESEGLQEKNDDDEMEQVGIEFHCMNRSIFIFCVTSSRMTTTLTSLWAPTTAATTAAAAAREREKHRQTLSTSRRCLLTPSSLLLHHTTFLVSHSLHFTRHRAHPFHCWFAVVRHLAGRNPNKKTQCSVRIARRRRRTARRSSGALGGHGRPRF